MKILIRLMALCLSLGACTASRSPSLNVNDLAFANGSSSTDLNHVPVPPIPPIPPTK